MLVLYSAEAEFIIGETSGLTEDNFDVWKLSKLYELVDLRAGWTLATEVLIPAAKMDLCAFNVNETAKAVWDKVINEVRQREQSLSFNLFRRAELIAKARTNRLTAEAYAKFAIMQLFKHFSTLLRWKYLTCLKLSIRSGAECGIFNGGKASLSSNASNEVLIQTVSLHWND
ncbi:MAG: hypothetical protein ACTS6G_04885 [Candidatus Hodgkinia cicadicola]